MFDSKTQFNSCSYDELTYCLRHRLEWIRSYRKSQADGVLVEYPNLNASLRLSCIVQQMEIKRLLKMRRVLKRSNYKNWNSEFLTEN